MLLEHGDPDTYSKTRHDRPWEGRVQKAQDSIGPDDASQDEGKDGALSRSIIKLIYIFSVGKSGRLGATSSYRYRSQRLLQSRREGTLSLLVLGCEATV